MADGDRVVEARALHPMARVWLRRRGARGTRPCPERDPLARSCQRCRPPVAWAVEAWAEKMNRKAVGWGPVAAAASEADGRAGVSGVLGRLVGRVRARWVKGGRDWASWAVKPSRPGCCEASFFLFFFSVLFVFFFI